MQPVKVVLAGACGYGGFYLNPLLDKAAELGAELVGVADPKVEQCERFNTLQERATPTFSTLQEFYDAGHTADLAIIAAPIHFHLSLSRLAVEHGACVLCEKPLAATAEEAEQFVRLERDAPGFIAVGYQWSFAPATQDLKRDILAGNLGKPKRLKTMTLWPRAQSYYQRNNWAGAICMPDGTPVHDSPANNATAHYLHNMLYVLGEATAVSARPVHVESRLYRTKPTENFDSAAMHVKTNAGADVWFYTTHAVKDRLGPVYEFEFENATVKFGPSENGICAHFNDGRTKTYGSPEAGGRQKIVDCINAARSGDAVCCGVEAAAAQTFVIDALQKHGHIKAVPCRHIKHTDLDNGDSMVWAEGLAEAFQEAYGNWRLPTYP